MDNPTSLDAIVTSSLTGAGSPSLSEQDQFDRVCMTPTALSPDPKGRFPVTHLSLPGNEAFGGRARAATEPHFAGFGVPDTSPERSRPSSASVSGPRPPLSALARSGSTVHDSLAVNTSQGAFSSNNVAASATSYHGEAAPAAAADGAARALEVQRLRVALVRKLEESEILEGVYKAQALALGVAVDGTSLEPLLIQDGMGVAGKPARVLRDLEGETRMPPEDVDPKTDATIR